MRQTTRFYLFIFCFFSQLVFAGDAVYQKDGIAIGGYDPVSYHTTRKASKGDSQYAYQWNSGSWHFSSQSNMELFAANPEKYAPRYGGFCAYAASKGALAPTDPQAWTVKDNRLYLNYSTAVRSKWREDIDDNIALANKNWPDLRAK
jgi:YHS domain-containing protein